jgi:hypothetical protein
MISVASQMRCIQERVVSVLLTQDCFYLMSLAQHSSRHQEQDIDAEA